MSHLPIWYMGNFPHDVIDMVVRDLSALEPRNATMGIEGEKNNHAERNTTVAFAQPDYWFGKTMFGYSKLANEKCEWNYDIDDHESVQFAKYGVDQHYMWHTDTFVLSRLPKDRKLTVIVLLNDPCEFDGGEFQIRHNGQFTAPLTKGSIICFPSILEHRVTPVTRGLRMSATLWIKGPKFK